MTEAMITFEVDDASLDDVVGRYLGPWLAAKCDSVAVAAQQMAPIGKPDPLGRNRPFPIHLNESLVSWVEGELADMVGFVAAETPYAYFVHEGTAPHPIQPIDTGYPLRFWWDVTGREERFRRVNHPGSQGNPFLRNALINVISASPG